MYRSDQLEERSNDDTLMRNAEEETKLSTHRDAEVSKVQLVCSPEHRKEPQVLLIDIEEEHQATYKKIITEDDTPTDNVAVCNAIKTKDSKITKNAINIYNICSISFKSYSEMQLIEGDQPRLREKDEELFILNKDSIKIAEMESIPCFICKRASTVFCDNCRAQFITALSIA